MKSQRCNPDMRYENPLYLAEEAASLYQLSGGRVALGVSRGAPEVADRGWEAFGYTGSTDPRGADIARPKFDQLMAAVRGETMVDADPAQHGRGMRLHVEPHSPGLDERIWWGAGSRETAEWAGREGVNLMSSTLLTEATGEGFSHLQAEQIRRYREAWKEAGHDWTPRVSVSRSIFPIVSEVDRKFFALRGVALLVETIEKVRDRLNPAITLDGILATMYDARTLHSREVLERVVETFGDDVLETVIGRTVKFPDASVAGAPITTFAPDHMAADAYRQLARELIYRGAVA